jgi:hypothetical protein
MGVQVVAGRSRRRADGVGHTARAAIQWADDTCDAITALGTVPNAVT